MHIKDRIKELRRVPAKDLLPNSKNWRSHPDAQADALSGVLSEIGFANAVLARETPHGRALLDGHLRAEVATDGILSVLALDVTPEKGGLALAATHASLRYRSLHQHDQSISPHGAIGVFIAIIVQAGQQIIAGGRCGPNLTLASNCADAVCGISPQFHLPFHRHDIHRYAHAVMAAAEEDAFDGTDVVVVAAPGESDVTRRGDLVVGRIDIQPAQSGQKTESQACVASAPISAALARRRIGPQIAADIPCGQTQRTQTGDLQVSEVLAHSPSPGEAPRREAWRPSSPRDRIQSLRESAASGRARLPGSAVPHRMSRGRRPENLRVDPTYGESNVNSRLRARRGCDRRAGPARTASQGGVWPGSG